MACAAVGWPEITRWLLVRGEREIGRGKEREISVCLHERETREKDGKRLALSEEVSRKIAKGERRDRRREAK